MQQCSSYRLPELDYILVDDYWFSFVLQKYLSAYLVKIKPSVEICSDFINSEDPNICLYKQPKVIEQKNRFFCYHSLKNWPKNLVEGKSLTLRS